MNGTNSSIHKTALNFKNELSGDQIVRNDDLIRFRPLACIKVNLVRLKPCSRIDHLESVRQIGVIDAQAGLGESDNLFCSSAVVPFFCRISFSADGRVKVYSGFSAGVLILHNAFDRFVFLNLIYSRGQWPYPCTACGDDFFSRCLSLFGRGCSLLFGGCGSFLSGNSLQADRLIDLNHFVDLPADSTKGAGNQSYRDPISKFLSTILALLFFTVGCALTFYGVNKSREIGGWAAWIVFAGFLFIIAASIFLLSGAWGVATCPLGDSNSESNSIQSRSHLGLSSSGTRKLRLDFLQCYAI
jgi:hypothetical protein